MSESTATVESDERPALHVCECCMMKFENDDESSCRDYYGHDHKAGTLVQDYALSPDEEFQSTVSRRCDTCGSEIGAFGTIHVYEPIVLDPAPGENPGR